MELKQLLTFRTVATLGSFNQAAEVLDYAQSSVSEQIKSLETDLQVTLFDRKGKQVSLTAAGELLLHYAQKMINLEEEIRSEIKGNEEVYGSLSIRIPETISTYYLPPILKLFKNRFPKVAFEFNSCSSVGLREELRSGITNLAFLITDHFRDVDLDTRILLQIPLSMVTYPDNPVAAKTNIDLSLLANQPVYVTSSDCSYFNILKNLFAEEKLKFKNLLCFNSLEAIKRNMIAGTGVALLPAIAVKDEIARGLLVKLPLDKDPLCANIIMIWLKNKWHPPILEAFMEMTREIISIKK